MEFGLVVVVRLACGLSPLVDKLIHVNLPAGRVRGSTNGCTRRPCANSRVRHTAVCTRRPCAAHGGRVQHTAVFSRTVNHALGNQPRAWFSERLYTRQLVS